MSTKLNQAASNIKGMFDNLSTKVFQASGTPAEPALNSMSSQDSPEPGDPSVTRGGLLGQGA